MTTTLITSQIPNAADLESLLQGDLNDLTAEVMPDLPNSFAGEVGEAVYEMAQSGELLAAEEEDFFAAIEAEVEESDRSWFDRLAEGDWGYFAFAAVEAVQGTWLEGVFNFFMPDFLDLQAQKEQVLRLTQNPHNVLLNLRERVERASAIPGMETEAFGLPLADLDRLLAVVSEDEALLESFPYESDADEQADWWGKAFEQAGLNVPSTVVLSVLTGESEWTLFLGDANQRVLEQLSTEAENETEAEPERVEMYEENGVMMHPEYGEMVLLSQSEFYIEGRNQLGHWQRYLRNNEDIVIWLGATFVGSLIGGGTEWGSFAGLASLPLDHPLLTAASVSLLVDTSENVQEAYYPKDRDAFIRFIKDRAEESGEPYAQKLSQLRDDELSQLYDWMNGAELPDLSAESLVDALQPHLNPTPENQWRQTQLSAFRQLRNTDAFLPLPVQQNEAVTSTLDEIINYYREFDPEGSVEFDVSVIERLIQELNSHLSAYDMELVADGSTLYLERPESTLDNNTVRMRLAIAINPYLELTEQWETAPYFFGDSSAASLVLRGFGDEVGAEFADVIENIQSGNALLAVMDGVLFYADGAVQRVVPYELLSYVFGVGEDNSREWSTQQFAYTYGGAASSLMLIGATSGLITEGRTGAWLGLVEGALAPINTLQNLVNPRLALSQVRSQLRQSRHFMFGFAGRLFSPERAGAHRELRRLEELRSIMARYQFSSINRRTPILTDALIRRANDIIKTSPIELPFRSIQDGDLLQKLGQLDDLIREQRATRLSRSLGERLSLTGTPERRVSIIEEIDVVIEHLERRKNAAVRRLLSAFNSGDESLIRYAQNQVLESVRYGQRVINGLLPIRRTAFSELPEALRSRAGSTEQLLERLRSRIEMPRIPARGRGLAGGIAALAGVLLLSRVLEEDEMIELDAEVADETRLDLDVSEALTLETAQTRFEAATESAVLSFESLNLAQGLSVSGVENRLTPEGVDVLVLNHEAAIEDLKGVLSNPETKAAVRVLLEDDEDKRIEIGTVALTLEDGVIYLNSTSPSRFEERYWQLIDHNSPYNVQRVVADATGSDMAGYAADFGTYMVPFVGPYRDLQNSVRDGLRGNWRSCASNAFFGIAGAVVDSIAWGGSLFTFGGSAAVGTGAKAGLGALRTTRQLVRVRTLDVALMSAGIGLGIREMIIGAHDRRERI